MKALINVTPLWEYLKQQTKPVLLYGMGNGADMIINVLETLNISWQDTFASDGFVRGHFFHGKKVLTLSEAEEKYGDFIILMTFAVHDEKTMAFVKELSKRHELYSPTVAVVGGEPFTYEFFSENEHLFKKVYDLLADKKSKEDYLNVLRYKISGNTEYLFKAHSEKMKVYSEILQLGSNETIVDLGAYDGDTIREFIEATDNRYNKIIAFEPDSKNFRKLTAKTENLSNIEKYNLGAWDKNETLYFAKKGGRNSRADEGGVPVQFDSVDNIVSEKVTLIKMDIEGAEMRALDGAKNTIKKYLPKLYVCAYHRNEDLFSLALKINELSAEYKIYFRQHPYIPAWESNFYAIPIGN
ncbi:MAG: FkbM family methyltransferase [Clostridia bacterium]|nr:FkbM family methyltransferase [Clostridia bacterium]